MPRHFARTALSVLVPFIVGLGCSAENDAVSPLQSPVGSPEPTLAMSSAPPAMTTNVAPTTPAVPVAMQPVTDEIVVDREDDIKEPEKDPNEPPPEAEVMTMVTEECASTAVSAVDKTSIQPADIIIAIDTSGSMDAEAAFVQENMTRFAQQISDSGIDVHVILIASAQPEAVVEEEPMGDAGVGFPQMGGGFGLGGDPPPSFGLCLPAPLGSGTCPADEKLPGYRHVALKVGSNDMLNKIVDTFDQWKDQLRPEATKSFMIVSDDDATAMPNNSAQTFTNALTALSPELFAEWSFSGIYCSEMCEYSAAIGLVFQDLVAQTGGISGELCDQDFQPVFDRLAEQIIQDAGSEIACEWELPAPPVGQTFSVDLVEVGRTTETSGTVPFTRVPAVEQCALNSWYFDDPLNPTKILACPETCEAMQGGEGGKIDVSFSCELIAGCAASSASAVTDMAMGCTFPLPEPPEDVLLSVETVNVRYQTPSGFGVVLGTVPNLDACAGVVGGWYFDNADKPTTITLCPATCDEYEAGTVTNVQALFGCEAKPAQPGRPR